MPLNKACWRRAGKTNHCCMAHYIPPQCGDIRSVNSNLSARTYTFIRACCCARTCLWACHVSHRKVILNLSVFLSCQKYSPVRKEWGEVKVQYALWCEMVLFTHCAGLIRLSGINSYWQPIQQPLSNVCSAAFIISSRSEQAACAAILLN